MVLLQLGPILFESCCMSFDRVSIEGQGVEKGHYERVALISIKIDKA